MHRRLLGAFLNEPCANLKKGVGVLGIVLRVVGGRLILKLFKKESS